MTSRVPELAEKLLQLAIEYTSEEFVAAYGVLGRAQGAVSALSVEQVDLGLKRKSTGGSAARKKGSIEEERSKAVGILEKIEPEKYRLLLQFEELLRHCEILPEVEDIRRLGARLDKEFDGGTSRRSAVRALMSSLATRPIEELQVVVGEVLSALPPNDKSDGFQELAKFLIRGR